MSSFPGEKLGIFQGLYSAHGNLPRFFFFLAVFSCHSYTNSLVYIHKEAPGKEKTLPQHKKKKQPGVLADAGLQFAQV